MNKRPPRFVISPYHRSQANKLGVTIRYSDTAGKKLDVYKNRKKVASIGAKGYWDFMSFKKAEALGIFPRGYAEQRRSLYRLRHNKERNANNTAGFYAYHILW